MRRHELSDARWAQIADLMPRNQGRGGRWREHRRIVNGMFWKLNTGAPWRDIPERYGPWQTIYDRFVRWGGRTARSTASWSGCSCGWARRAGSTGPCGASTAR